MALQLKDTLQVRLVTDLKQSLAYYRDALGCEVDTWGHATRDGMKFILQQARSPEDVRPNAAAQLRQDYPTDWEGPETGWDTFVHVDWDDFDPLYDTFVSNGARVGAAPFEETHNNGMTFRNFYILDPDGYVTVFGAMHRAD